MDKFSSTINIDGCNYEISMEGPYIEPLFRAIDIFEILSIENTNDIIKDFDKTQKKEIDFNNKKEEFLTVKGMNKLLYKQNKSPIILIIQDWLSETIKTSILKEIKCMKMEFHDHMNYIIDEIKCVKQKEFFKRDDSDCSDDDN